MSDRKQALTDLLEKVEAGKGLVSDVVFDAFSKDGGSVDISSLQVLPAYNGSLDAAKALHEAVLPGWTVRLCAFTPHGKSAPHVHVFRMRQAHDDPSMGGNSAGYSGDNPARAWLIAVLKALIAKEEEL